MAKRPAWKIDNNGILIQELYEFSFNAGFAVTQKKKNIKALHESIGKKTLEVSTKSDDELGIKLSAFNLKLDNIAFECIFQSSKVFENGGPYLDLLQVTPKEAKRDERLKSSGKLISFKNKNEEFPLEPKTFFYDYMYIKAVKESLSDKDIQRILDYEYFTDIEFNPNKSINCQAKSVAIIKAMLMRFGTIPDLTKEEYLEFYKNINSV